MRSKRAPKRLISPDPIYNSKLVTKLINRVMFDGKKSIARNLVYKALDKVKEVLKQDPISVLDKALVIVSPKMEVRPRRVGGASYQVPVEVKGDRRESLGLRWLVKAANDRPNSQYHTFDLKLATEIIDAANGAGGAVKKKADVEKVAAANRAFSHFRW